MGLCIGEGKGGFGGGGCCSVGAEVMQGSVRWQGKQDQLKQLHGLEASELTACSGNLYPRPRQRITEPN